MVLKNGIGLKENFKYKKGFLFLKFFFNNYIFGGFKRRFNFKNRNKFIFFWYLNYFRSFAKLLKFNEKKYLTKRFYRDIVKNEYSKNRYFRIQKKFGGFFIPLISVYDCFLEPLIANNNFFKKIALFALRRKLSLDIFNLEDELVFDLSFKRRNYYITFYNLCTGKTILNISAGCSDVNTFLNRRRFFTFAVFKDCFKKLWRFGWNKNFVENYNFLDCYFPQISNKNRNSLAKGSKLLFFYGKKLVPHFKRWSNLRTKKWLSKLVKRNKFKPMVSLKIKVKLHCNSPAKSRNFYSYMQNYVNKNYFLCRYYFVSRSFFEFEYLIKYKKLRLKNKRRV